MFSLEQSQDRARARLGRTSGRRRRSDAGRPRISPVALAAIRAVVLGADRPPIDEILRRVKESCVRHGVRPPSRATVYNSLATIEGHTYRVATLPPEARRAVYNLSADASVPGHQLAHYCFNHGSLAAACFAAGLPWLDLYQASRLPGWRPRSRGLLLAAMRARGLQ